ncbi:MAG: glycerol-3-phosphate acyltransferase [Promethearchaeota archaeon]|jgi:glycerol-3-phosphate acyltransferase PlsY
MSAYLIFISVISIIIGYILGSILPAYFIGRLKGIDIRTVGSKNAGTSNVYHELGLKYAVLTGFYDFFKGLLAIWISFQLQPNFLIAQLAGYAAIIGHVSPFYINFRGGQGLATSMAILIYYMINYILEDTIILIFLLYILLILILFKLTSKVTNLLAIIMYPLIGYAVWVYYPQNRFNIFVGIILSYIVIMAFYNIVKFKTIKIEKALKQYWWKLALNPVLIILIILYAYLPLLIPIILTGTLAIIIGFIDFFIFLNKNRNGRFFSRLIPFFKNTEEKILSISIILTSMFLTMLIFSYINKELVIATLTYFLFGITFSGFFEKAFGKRKFIHRTLEGLMGFIISVLIFAFVLYSILELTPITLLIGGLSVALFHSLPLRVNNNLVVPIMSCLTMTIILYLGL